METNPKIINLSEACVILGRSEDWVRKHAAKGALKATKINDKAWVFFQEDVEQYIKANTKSFTGIKKMLKEQAEKSYSPTTLNTLAYIQKDLLGFQSAFKMHNVEKALLFLELAIEEIEGVLAGVQS